MLNEKDYPHTFGEIPAHGVWTGNNQLGIMRPTRFDSSRRQTVLKLDEWGPPEVWTISLFIQDVNPLITLGDVSIKAEIAFGVGGSTQIIQVDWENGTEISKVMNSVNIQAVFGETSDPDIGLNIGVQIARGGRGGNRNAYNSLQRLALLDATSETDYIQVPNFAAELLIVPADVTKANHDLVYSDDVVIATYPGNQLVQPAIAMVTGADILKGRYLPVIAGSRYLKVINNGGTGIAYTLYANMYG